MLQLLGAGRLEGVHLATLRIDAGHDVLDYAVLAGGVHGLQHDQHGPAPVRIEPLLQFRQPADAVGKDRLHLGGLGGQAERFSGTVIGEAETARLPDPAGLDDFRKLHGRLMEVCTHNQ